MHSWTLPHPNYGLLEVRVAPLTELSGDLAALEGKLRSTDEYGAELRIDGKTVSRIYDLVDSLVLRFEPIAPDVWDDEVLLDRCIDIDSHAVTNRPYAVVLSDGETRIEFDAPESSPHRRWQRLSQRNPNYAVVVPLLSGLTAAALAYLVLTLMNLVPFLPDIVGWTSHLIDGFFDLFEMQTPQWLSKVVDLSKVWQPILVGLITAAAARHTAMSSERTKRSWREGGSPA